MTTIYRVLDVIVIVIYGEMDVSFSKKSQYFIQDMVCNTGSCIITNKSILHYWWW